MRQRVAYSRCAFALSRELRPVVTNRPVIIDEAALGLNMKRSRGHGFGDGEDRKERVAIYSATSGLVGQATPDVNHQFTLEICRDLNPNLTALANCSVNRCLNNFVYISHVLSPTRMRSRISFPAQA